MTTTNSRVYQAVMVGGTKHDLPSILAVLLAFLPAMGYTSSSGRDSNQVLNRVRTALLDPAGHKLLVRWDYSSPSDAWTGTGTLEILGQDLLKLTFPDRTFLVKDSTIMAWYRDTDQVILDTFRPGAPANVFSLLLSGFDYFQPAELTPLSDTTTLVLKGRGPGMIQDITLVVDTRTWMPQTVEISGGQGAQMAIRVTRVEPLADSQALREETLSGSDWVDLRE